MLTRNGALSLVRHSLSSIGFAGLMLWPVVVKLHADGARVRRRVLGAKACYIIHSLPSGLWLSFIQTFLT